MRRCLPGTGIKSKPLYTRYLAAVFGPLMRRHQCHVVQDADSRAALKQAFRSLSLAKCPRELAVN